MTETGRVAQTQLKKLEAEATHARQRVDLYRAQGNGERPTNPDRLSKLERLSEVAESRLAEAKSR
jgi:hypothetical protein